MSISIAFTMQSQQEDEWCWAANAASAAAYYGSNRWSQCLLANNQFSQTTCCSLGSSDVCNRPWRLDLALAAAGCHYLYQGGAISLVDVVKYLTANSAIEARIGWTDGSGNFDGSGHFVAITAADPSSTMLHIADPWYPASDIGYNDFAQRYQTVGVWTDTFIIDGLVAGPAAGGGPPRPAMAETELIFQKASMALTTMKEELPLYTLSLDKAVAPQPLTAMRQTGTQTLMDQGVAEQASVKSALTIRADDRAALQAKATREATSTLKDARVLQIPSLLVTAIVGTTPTGGTAVKPIGRLPSFLQDRLYQQPEFEAIVAGEVLTGSPVTVEMPR